MSRKFLTPIDLTKLEIQNVALQNLGSDPGTPATGQIYFNTGGSVKVYNGSSWLTLSTSVGTVTSVTGTSPVSSTGGTTPAISLASGYGDTLNPYAAKTNNYVLAGAASGGSTTPTFRALVAADIPTTLSGTTFSGAVAMGTNRITGLGDPSAAQDAATKSYVDTIATGINAHDAVAYASTANVSAPYNNGASGVGATISGTNGPLVIDGYTVVSGDVGTNVPGGTALRILLKDQTFTDSNGIYAVTAVSGTNYTLTRAYDYDTIGEVSAGDFTYVLNGTANGKFTFVQTSKPAAISGLGTTANAITFGVFSNGNISGIVSANQGGTGVNNGSNTITLAGTLQHAGAFSQIFRATANTDITLPTTGTLLTSATAVTAGFTKKVTNSITLVANTQYTINHALATQAVLVQMFDSSWNLVEMDVLNFDANNVKVTSQTAGTYNFVIIG